MKNREPFERKRIKEKRKEEKKGYNTRDYKEKKLKKADEAYAFLKRNKKRFFFGLLCNDYNSLYFVSKIIKDMFDMHVFC